MVALAAILVVRLAPAASQSGSARSTATTTLDLDAVAGTRDPIARLNAQIKDGAVPFQYESSFGYLRPLLASLRIPIESQLLVFSPTSRQRDHITYRRPRAIYFSDNAAVGFLSGGELEVIAQEPGQGLVFYTLAQQPRDRPQLVRGTDCMQCHLLPDTGGAGGLQMMSVLPLADNRSDAAHGWSVDDRTPFADRWGGWYVTGQSVPRLHLGNVPVQHVPQSYVRAPSAPRWSSVDGRIDSTTAPLSSSDVVALLALGHQVRTVNLMTELRWRTRAAVTPGVDQLVRDLVDALVFAGAAPFPAPVRGAPEFLNGFASVGPRDAHGRSLRELDLNTRLLKYSLSYLIYSDTFDAIPDRAKALVYRRLWEVLSCADTSEPYSHMSPALRQDIVEILRDTKSDVSVHFK